MPNLDCRSDATVPISEHLEQVRNGSDGVGKKSKHMRTMAHKRHAEAEEKASKEKEEVAKIISLVILRICITMRAWVSQNI